MIRSALVVLLWAGATASASAQTANPPPPTSPFRYDDDPKIFADVATDDLYAKFKFIPLTDDSYLSFGADLRERVESSDVGLLGLVRPDGTNDRFSGIEQQISMVWRLNQVVTLNAAYVHFDAGDFINRGGGHDENFGMTSLSFRL
jgi:hypothetical protein